MRFVALILSLLLVWPAAADAASNLRAEIVVDSNEVTLGDIFTDAGEVADIIIFEAPEPGRHQIYWAEDVYRIANAHGIDWWPDSSHDKIVIERASQVVTQSEIEAHLIEALQDSGAGDRLDIVLSGRNVEFHLPAGDVTPLEVRDLDFNPRNARFNAVLAAWDADGVLRSTRITGHAYAIVEIPVLTRRARPGHIIGYDELDWIEMRADRLERDAVMEPEEVVGMSPRRAINANTPILMGDLQHPTLVTKNGAVTMVYRTPLMTLTALGRALEDGVEGAFVRVLNPQSNTVVQGVVTGKDEVVMPSPYPTASN